MHAAALDRGAQHFGSSTFQALVFIRDDQFDPTQAPIGQSAQELVPERLGFAGLNGDAQNLAPSVCVDRNRHYGRTADDPPRAADLDVGGVQPEVWPFALQRPVKEGVNTFIDLGAQARDLALGDAGHAHLFYQIID